MPDLMILAEAAAEHGGEHVPYVELNAFGVTVTAWVSIAMVILIAIVLWKKVPAVIAGALDKRIAEIRTQLDEAKELRVEAEKLRAEYESKMAVAESEAEDMKARAESEAEQILADARANATALIDRRKVMAEEKIAAAERAALADIKGKIATAATDAAARLIAEKHGAEADSALVDRTIAGLGSKLN